MGASQAEKADKILWDVFISHASEDKVSVARPLAELLQRSGLAVWLDQHTLKLGDSLREKIDEGLGQSRYGVVIVSPSFFTKKWPKRELDGLFTREDVQAKVILPVWHEVSAEEVTRASPLLASRLAVSTSEGLDRVAEAILAVVKPEAILPPPRLEDIFSRDPSISLSAAERLSVDESIDVSGVVSALRALNPVTTLAVRTFLARLSERSAPLMVAHILKAHQNWGAAASVPDCFHPMHRPFCEEELGKAATGSYEPDVARKAIESLGFLSADGWAWSLLSRLRSSDDYLYGKIESYVVEAIARMFQLLQSDSAWHQGYVGQLRDLFMTLEETIRTVADHGWRSRMTYGSVMDILALCPTDRADLFLEKWLNADHSDLRCLAVHTLGQMRLQRSVRHLLDHLGDADSRQNIIMALGNIGGPEAVAAIRNIILHGGTTGNAGMALSAAAETVEDPAELEVIADMLLDANVSEECFVYRAMGMNGDARFTDRVRRGLDHRDATVRAHSALAIARLTGSAESKRLREMHREAGSPMERSLIGMARIVAADYQPDEALLDGLRNDLAVESYLYKRMTRDDFVMVLRGCGSDKAQRMADSWSRIYSTRPAY
ncbi:MAG: TIR domain-containing protein [Nitrospira sp.]